MRPLEISLIILLLITSCKKQDIPVVATAEVTSVTPSSATINAKILSYGEGEIISKGFLLGEAANFLTDTIFVEGNELGEYFYNLTNLIPEQEYFVKAFATNSYGNGYGKTISFTTDQASLPTVNTLNVYSITCTTATSGGEITDDGGVQISDRGICWGVSENPTKTDNYISLENMYKIDLFSHVIKNLEINSPYYVRAYATNYAGTSYGESVQFSTKPTSPDYDPHSIIGTWQCYYACGGISGCDSTIFGTTFIREFTSDSITIGRFIGGSIIVLLNFRFTISGNTIIHLNESGEEISHEEFEINNSGDSLLIRDSVFRNYFNRLY